jgi:hypothetical protein
VQSAFPFVTDGTRELSGAQWESGRLVAFANAP